MTFLSESVSPERSYGVATEAAHNINIIRKVFGKTRRSFLYEHLQCLSQAIIEE